MAKPTSARLLWRGRLPVILPLGLYLVLTLAGITNSNIGIDTLRQDPSHHYGIEIGHAAAIRSDEYLTESAITLGQMAVGEGDALNPLSVSPNFFSQLPSGPVSAVVFFDGSMVRLGSWLPNAMLFAAKWWLPSLLLVIGMPLWFRLVTGHLRWGYLATVLTLVAPASMWWSGRPVNTLGFMFAGCVLAIRAADELERGRWLRFGAATVLAGVLFARLPTYYQPLAIMLGFPVLLATVGFILSRGYPMRVKVLTLSSLAITGGVFTTGLILESLPAIRSALQTVYPGQRKSTGETNIFGRVFGATDLGFLKPAQRNLIGTNATELASSFTVVLIIVVLLLATGRWRAERSVAAAFWPVFACAVFWLSWCTVSYGEFGRHLPLVNLVPAFRATNATGFIAVIAFCLFMSRWPPPKTLAAPAVAGVVTAFVSVWAGLSLQADLMPSLSVPKISVSALIAGMAVFALVAWPHRQVPLVAAGLAACLLTFTAMPIEVGLGDLRASPTARAFIAEGKAARERGDLWASNSTFVDALMLATGTPALSYRQQMGPVTSRWQRLDPTLAHEGVWNRGGSFIMFDWVAGPGVKWSNPHRDQIVLTASPCTIASAIPHLKFVVSTKALSDSCLVPYRTLVWNGINQVVYRVT